jgi:hypothetical protein
MPTLPLDPEIKGSATRLQKSREVLTKDFDPHQPRDFRGRWTHGGHLMHDATKEMLSTSAQISADKRMGGPSRHNLDAIEVRATKKFNAGEPLTDDERDALTQRVFPSFKREYPRSGARHEQAEVALSTPRDAFSGLKTEELREREEIEEEEHHIRVNELRAKVASARPGEERELAEEELEDELRPGRYKG